METLATLLHEIDDHVDRAVERAIEEAVAKLESEKARLTQPLDEKIAALRVRQQQLVSPQLPLPAPRPTFTAPAQTRRLPRGRTQRATYLYIEENPGIGYRELVEGLDGQYTEKGYNKYRNVLRALKDGGWVTGEPEAWVLHVPPEDAEE